jgi:hypothetical protein
MKNVNVKEIIQKINSMSADFGTLHEIVHATLGTLQSMKEWATRGIAHWEAQPDSALKAEMMSVYTEIIIRLDDTVQSEKFENKI